MRVFAATLLVLLVSGGVLSLILGLPTGFQREHLEDHQKDPQRRTNWRSLKARHIKTLSCLTYFSNCSGFQRFNCYEIVHSVISYDAVVNDELVDVLSSGWCLCYKRVE